MCLITPEGQELSRIVGKAIAKDLSDQEASAPFFKPGFETRHRSVYTSPIYMSPDANKWVIAYVTPVGTREKTDGILHYEHSLEVYQRALLHGLDASHGFVVAVNRTGWVVADTRRKVPVAKKNDSEDAAAYFAAFRFGNKTVSELLASIDSGTEVVGDDGITYDAAYQNVEHWTLIAFKAES